MNDAIRAGLRADQAPSAAPPPFRVTPKEAGFRAGVDPMRLNRLLDEMDEEMFAEGLGRRAAGR